MGASRRAAVREGRPSGLVCATQGGEWRARRLRFAWGAPPQRAPKVCGVGRVGCAWRARRRPHACGWASPAASSGGRVTKNAKSGGQRLLLSNRAPCGAPGSVSCGWGRFRAPRTSSGDACPHEPAVSVGRWRGQHGSRGGWSCGWRAGLKGRVWWMSRRAMPMEVRGMGGQPSVLDGRFPLMPNPATDDRRWRCLML